MKSNLKGAPVKIIELSDEQRNYLVFLLHIRVSDQLDHYRECKSFFGNPLFSDDKAFYQGVINEICSDFVTCISCFKLFGVELFDRFNDSDRSLIKEIVESGEADEK